MFTNILPEKLEDEDVCLITNGNIGFNAANLANKQGKLF